MGSNLHPLFEGIIGKFANTPPGFKDPALIDETINDFTADEYLLAELPHFKYLDTEDKNFEQE